MEGLEELKAYRAKLQRDREQYGFYPPKKLTDEMGRITQKIRRLTTPGYGRSKTRRVDARIRANKARLHAEVNRDSLNYGRIKELEDMLVSDIKLRDHLMS